MTNLLDHRFDEALDLAVQAHRLRPRAETSVSHLGHLLAVASLVIDDGGDADQAIAALLHDVGLDGDGSIAEVGRLFGSRVERIVRAVGGGRHPPWSAWRQVKSEHVAGIPSAPPESWRVSLADALSEARYVVADLREHGPLAYSPDQGRALQWYHRALADTYAHLLPGRMLDEYTRVVAEIESTPW
ncbi:MAG: HD domain-containing protein [Acidimicrobiia bacterium]|nr:HD domain-containing protein [Acidimicrobiia bacterium]